MSRYVDADIIEYHYLPISVIGDMYVTKKEIDDIPTADVEEIRHGKWIKLDTASKCSDAFKCSICDRRVWDDKGMPLSKIYERNPYCHCGAKMDLRNEE